MVDKFKLFSVMKKNSDTRLDLAKAIGISGASLSGKMNGWKNRCFNLKEIEIIVDRYKLTEPEIFDIFFAEKCLEQ